MDSVNKYRDNHSSSDDDSEDSDKECTVWKRATAVKRIIEDENVPNVQSNQVSEACSNPKRKINTIWTEVLEDQLISEDLESCLLKNKPAHYDSRGKESYDYTLKYKDPRLINDVECPMEEEYCIKGTNSLPRMTKSQRYVKLDCAEKSAARKIIKVLSEKKVYLIYRIVKIVGIEKAMTLLNMTEQIEETGGMMTNNNSRRRTPGGVYIQLLKTDKDVTREMLNKIFEGEMNCVELKKYYTEIKKRKKQNRNERKEKQLKEITDLKMKAPDMTMDAEESYCLSSPINSNLDNKPVSEPSLVKVSSDNASDLEEGEIED